MAQRLRVDEKKFIKDLTLEINFNGGDRCETGKPYERLMRLRLPMTSETRIQPNPKRLELSKVLSHRATMDATLC